MPTNVKDFSKSLKKLLASMNKYWFLILIATIFASTSSILTLKAPDMLTNLTDELTEGLVPQEDILKDIASNIKNNLSEEKLNELNTKLISIDTNRLLEVFMNNNTSSNDREILNEIKNNNYSNFNKLSNDVLNNILKDVTIDDKTILKKDIITYLKSNGDIKAIPNVILNLLLNDFVIEDVVISASDQLAVINLFDINDDTNKEDIIKKFDKLPSNVYNLVKPKIDMDSVKSITIKIAIIYGVTTLFTFIEGLIIVSVAIKYSKETRTKIIAKINKLPLKYFDNTTVGDLLSRITNDVNMINSTMNDSLSTLISALTLFIGSIIMMFTTNWIMALTAILSSIIGFVFLSIILVKSQKYFVARQNELGKLNGHIEEAFTNHEVIKLYNGKNISNKTFDKLNNKVYVCEKKSQFLSGLMPPVMGFVGNLGYVAVCIMGAILTMKGYISFGVIVAFMMYVRLFTNPLSEIAQALSSLQSGTAASKRVFEFLDQDELIKESVSKKLDKKKAKGLIEFNNVCFGYNDDKMIIKNFNAHIKPGEKIAIVGPTGAGKTTLVNLLMRFYEINSGDIKIDDVSVKDITRENVHDLFIMVLQDTWLMNGTIRDNIKFNNNASDEDIWKVCKEVGIDHFVKTLSNGLDTKISDANNISSGQKQLITIARGMLKDAPFLILDEATSNVDTRTEELVQLAMDKLMKNKTSFIIAHRLSTIRNANLILYLENGNIKEQGTHEELLEKNGAYAKLYNSQFEKIN